MEESGNRYEPQEDNLSNKYEPRRTKKFKKSNHNKIVFGVAGGMGEYFSVEPVIFRLMFLFGILIGGWGIIIYLVTALLMPRDNEPEEIDDDEIEKIRQSNNISLIAGIILLAGFYIILDDFGYFSFLSIIGLPADFIIALLSGAIIFFIFTNRGTTITEKPACERFTRNKQNALFGGVCSGFADYLGVKTTTVRMAVILLSLLTLGTPLIIYFYFLAKIPNRDKNEL